MESGVIVERSALKAKVESCPVESSSYAYALEREVFARGRASVAVR